MAYGYQPPLMPVVTQTYVFASTWRRFFAWVLDWLVVFVIALVVGAILGVTETTTSTSTGSNGQQVTTTIWNLTGAWLWLMPGIVSAAYFIPTWVAFGHSPFQAALGMRVARADAAVHPDLVGASIRWAGLFGWTAALGVVELVMPGAVGGLLGLVGFGWTVMLLVTTAIDGQHRGFHDELARTVVVRRQQMMMVPVQYPQAPQGYAPQPPQGYAPQPPAGYPQPPAGYPQPPTGYPQPPAGYPPQAPTANPPEGPQVGG